MDVWRKKHLKEQCSLYGFENITDEILEYIENKIQSTKFQEILEELVFMHETKAFRIVQKGDRVCDVISNYRLDLECFDQKKMAKKNMKMFRIHENSRDILSEDYFPPLTITKSFWTCKCDKHFIRSIYLHKCPACGSSIADGIQRCKDLNDIINEY